MRTVIKRSTFSKVQIKMMRQKTNEDNLVCLEILQSLIRQVFRADHSESSNQLLVQNRSTWRYRTTQGHTVNWRTLMSYLCDLKFPKTWLAAFRQKSMSHKTSHLRRDRYKIYENLEPLTDFVCENLDVLFIGCNPGLQSSK